MLSSSHQTLLIMKWIKYCYLVVFCGYNALTPMAQTYTKADTTRGSITKERSWWDLKHYDLKVEVDPQERTLQGSNTISYTVLEDYHLMQIDLQAPLKITRVEQEGNTLPFTSEGSAHYVVIPADKHHIGSTHSITVHYEGQPHVAIRAPWDGGITWQEDNNGNPYVASSCQGIGASIWWPCKDHMYDEVDSMDITIITPAGLMAVANGQLIETTTLANETNSYHWAVKNPINNYGVNLSVGDYVYYDEVYQGEKGALQCSYYVLRDNLEKAKKQFVQVPMLLRAFEHWFGPYPFYTDGFKLIEVPYLGMEHQSAVTYGNGYSNGYKGTDLSGSGWGMKFDYIIIHESGHEWFANNITYKDRADMWIHESFTTYSESLYIEYYYGVEAGAEYIRGLRRLIANDRPIIADYGVNAMGSGDMYFKGSNILHTLRQVVGDDDRWRSLLRGLNEHFYHQTVTSQEFESYISESLGINLDPFFDQYLRTSARPVLEYYYDSGKLRFRWAEAVAGFDMPIRAIVDGKSIELSPTSTWRQIDLEGIPREILIDPNYYIAASQIIP